MAFKRAAPFLMFDPIATGFGFILNAKAGMFDECRSECQLWNDLDLNIRFSGTRVPLERH
jgi:hypothetical protein